MTIYFKFCWHWHNTGIVEQHDIIHRQGASVGSGLRLKMVRKLDPNLALGMNERRKTVSLPVYVGMTSLKRRRKK